MEIEERNCELFSGCQIIYLTCIDLNEQVEFKITGISCLRLVTVVGHICFPEKLGERRRVLFLRDGNLKCLLEELKSPVVIKILSSSYVQVRH